ncbi:MAG: ATP-binding cassette domain-containing protein [Myxococcales bacterium]|nr:ATP-binding cassette domain-containing protein [Myxococcales bacterium]
MGAVVADALNKTFRVLDHRPGLLGAVRNLFSAAGRDVSAVRDVSFTIEPGEMVGYVGPNGSGKSTTLKMLTGILRPTSGQAVVCGLSSTADRRALARRIGVVFGQRTQLWWDLPPMEGFRLLRHIYGVPLPDFERRLEELVERLALADVLDVPVRKLSLGQKMRCELVAALLHGPEVLFLDEPTIGLDVVVKEELHTFLRALNADHGTTMLLTSHDLDDIEQLCSRVIVIDRGERLHDGDLASLHRRYGHVRRISLQLAAAGEEPWALPDGAWVERSEGRQVVIAFDADRVAAPLLVRGVLSHVEVVDLAVHEARIEDVIKRIHRGPDRPLPAAGRASPPPER